MAFKNNLVFVDCKLSLNDKPRLDEYAKKYKGDVANVLESVLNDGYTVKAGWYPDKASFAVFLAPTKDNRQNQNKMMSAWSDDIIEAYFMLGFKHEIIFESGEWTVDDKQSQWG